MRLTQILKRQRPAQHYRLLWKNRPTVNRVKDCGIPSLLLERGTPVYDGLKFSLERERIDLSKFLPVEPKPPVRDWAYLLNEKTRLLEGPLQAQILTNSLAYDGLPQSYCDTLSSTSVSDEEVSWLTKRFALISCDSEQFKQPHKIDPERPWHRFPRYFAPGILREMAETTRGLADFMRFHCSPTEAKHKFSKQQLYEIWCQFMRPAAEPNVCHPHLFQGFSPVVDVSSAPLGPIAASTDTNDDSGGPRGPTGTLPSMYPALPEMDLKKVTNYEPETMFPNLPGVWLQTLFLTHAYDEDWPTAEKIGRTIVQAYSFAAAQAVKAMGIPTEMEELDPARRFRLQAIFHDRNDIGFVVFELNTLAGGRNGEASGPMRNRVWYEWTNLREEEQINPYALRWLKVFHAQ